MDAVTHMEGTTHITEIVFSVPLLEYFSRDFVIKRRDKEPPVDDPWGS